MRGGNQVPLAVHLLQAPQQKAPQTPTFLDLTVHRFHNRFALGVDPRSLLASELAGHADLAVGIFWERSAFRR